MGEDVYVVYRVALDECDMSDFVPECAYFERWQADLHAMQVHGCVAEMPLVQDAFDRRGGVQRAQ